MRRLLMVVLMLSVLKMSCGSPTPTARPKRGYNTGYGGDGYGGGGSSGYGHGYENSDERDASVSGEGCGSGEDGRSYGGSREYLRDRESKRSDRHRAHGYTRDPASAVAVQPERMGPRRFVITTS